MLVKSRPSVSLRALTVPFDEVKIEELAYFDVQDQSKFAEKECIVNARNKDYLIIQFQNFNPYDRKQFAAWNTKTLGNFAFLQLYCPYNTIVEKCISALAAYQIYLYEQGKVSI